MSNGDLDGDTYFVCWDEEIVKYFDADDEYGYETSEFDHTDFIKSLNCERPEREDIVDYLTWFYEKDITGQINNLHLAFCDYLGPSGPIYEIS